MGKLRRSTTVSQRPLIIQQSMENARAAYSSSVHLWTYEGGLIWSRFTAMIYANSILFAAIALTITSKTELGSPLIIAFALAGIVLCGCWYVLNQRGFAYYDLWARSATELESKFLEPGNTLKNGALFSSGESISFENGASPVQLHGVAKLRVRSVSNFIILLFVLVYMFVVGVAVGMFTN